MTIYRSKTLINFGMQSPRIVILYEDMKSLAWLYFLEGKDIILNKRQNRRWIRSQSKKLFNWTLMVLFWALGDVGLRIQGILCFVTLRIGLPKFTSDTSWPFGNQHGSLVPYPLTFFMLQWGSNPCRKCVADRHSNCRRTSQAGLLELVECH